MKRNNYYYLVKTSFAATIIILATSCLSKEQKIENGYQLLLDHAKKDQTDFEYKKVKGEFDSLLLHWRDSLKVPDIVSHFETDFVTTDTNIIFNKEKTNAFLLFIAISKNTEAASYVYVIICTKKMKNWKFYWRNKFPIFTYGLDETRQNKNFTPEELSKYTYLRLIEDGLVKNGRINYSYINQCFGLMEFNEVFP